jgi:hypothetical protein
MTNSQDRHWVGQKAAQMGFSEVLMNLAFYMVTQKKTATLYGLPSERPDARDFSATRFDPAIQHSPYLKSMLSASVSNNFLKMFGGIPLYIRGSRGTASFHSIPVGCVLLDEVDKMSEKAVREAIERLSGQIEFWLRQASTPSLPGVGISKTFQTSTQDFYTFQCPGCSRWTELVFPDCLVIPTDDPKSPAINNSYIKCIDCGIHLRHEEKPSFLSSGKWEPRFRDRNIRGFKISQLYSCTLHPARLAESYLNSLTNPADEQVLYNSKLGEDHIVAGAAVTEEHIHNCIRPFNIRSAATSPVVTMGVDVGSYLHFKIIEYRFQPNAVDPNTDSEAKLLYYDKIKNTEPGFGNLMPIVQEYNPLAICIDAAPERISSEKFAKSLFGRAFTVNYNDHTDGKTISDTDFFKLTVNRTYWIDQYLGRYMNGTIHIPVQINEEFRVHMKSLKKFYEKDRFGETIGRYVKTEGRTDYAHCGVYCEIALRKAYQSGHLSNLRVKV